MFGCDLSRQMLLRRDQTHKLRDAWNVNMITNSNDDKSYDDK